MGFNSGFKGLKNHAETKPPEHDLYPRRCHYFDVVVGFVWSHDPESYNGVSVVLPVGPPMPDRSRVMTQTKRYTLVLQVGGLAWG